MPGQAVVAVAVAGMLSGVEATVVYAAGMPSFARRAPPRYPLSLTPRQRLPRSHLRLPPPSPLIHLNR